MHLQNPNSSVKFAQVSTNAMSPLDSRYLHDTTQREMQVGLSVLFNAIILNNTYFFRNHAHM